VGRLTDNDKQLGPIVYGKVYWDALQFVWSSGGDEWEDTQECRNDVTIYCKGYVCRFYLPQILKPIVVDKGTYKIKVARKYGFSLSEGFFKLFLGASYHDSDIDKSWACFLPWTEWEMVRHSLYDKQCNLFFQWLKSKQSKRFYSMWEHKKDCSAVVFEFDDFDGKRINATTRIEERQWERGVGYFKWLRWFYKSKIVRSLDIEFSEEVGPEKGSYKGGTVGHSIDMLPNETHTSAFKRYCQQEHRSKYKPYHIQYVGRVETL